MNRRVLVLALVGLVLTGLTAAFSPGAGDYVSVNGMKMYYEIHGRNAPEAVPLVVLHGAYMNIPAMGAIIARLAETRQVYAPELQGHGRTRTSTGPSPIPTWPTMSRLSWTKVGLTKADVFGYSMGAVAGLQLAIRHPEKVNRLVAASVAYDDEGWQPEFKALNPADDGGDVRQHAVRRGVSKARRQSRRLS